MMDLNMFFNTADLNGKQNLITCPSCKDSYTRNMGVECISRYSEDAKLGTRVTIRGHRVFFENDAERGNPSERRDGVVLRFSCESGCDDFILTFAQHKGITYVDCIVLTGQGCDLNREFENAS
jgi:hypothetical protein